MKIDISLLIQIVLNAYEAGYHKAVDDLSNNEGMTLQ